MSTICLWLCYVDDTFAAVNKEVIHNFHEHDNKQIVDIQCTGHMVKYCFLAAWSLTKTTDFEQQCTENRHIPTDYRTSHNNITHPLEATTNTDFVRWNACSNNNSDTHTNANSDLAVMTATSTVHQRHLKLSYYGMEILSFNSSHFSYYWN